MSKELVPFKEFAIQEFDPATLKEALSANLGSSGINRFDFDQVKIPIGGGLQFEIPTLEGTETKGEIEGIIIFHKEVRSYWSQTMDMTGGGTPPDCSSEDGIVGQGVPGGPCAVCPFALFGSKAGGRGQACKQSKVMFVLLPDATLPIAMPLPPTSLQVAKRYFLRLSGKGVPYYYVVTKFGLVRDKNAQNMPFSRINLSVASILDAEDRPKIKQYIEQIKPALESIPLIGEMAETIF